MSTFSALRMTKSGAAQMERLRIDDLSPGDVTIRVEYSGLNYKDALAVTNRAKILRRTPINPGIDAAGVVLDSGDVRYRTGDRVLVTGCGLGESDDGGFGEVVRVRGDSVVPLPENLSTRESMILGTAGFTAALALHRLTHNGQSPEMGPMLITGATGGVGSFATQLFARAGYEVWAVTGKLDYAPYLKSLGAARVMGPDELELGDRPLETARFGGAVDNVGGDLLARTISHVHLWGSVAAIGMAQGEQLSTNVMPFILRGVSLIGISSNNTPMPTRLQLWQRLSGPWKPLRLEHMVTRTITPAEIPNAAADMLGRRTHGRILVQHARAADQSS